MSELDPKHEAAVEDFIEALREQDPVRVAAAEERYPVLTETELEWRRSREIRLSERFEDTLALSADINGRRIAAPLELRKSIRRVGVALAA